MDEDDFGLRPTGRQFKDPAATLVEFEDEHGLRHTGIVFDEAYRGQPTIGLDVELILSFLQYPMVVGLVELSHHDLERGLFLYPTGPVWTVKDLLRQHADLSRSMGLRAGLELAWLASQILDEAAKTGPQQGCFCHGNLTPWRLALRPDGQVQVFGYGLPQVEVHARRHNPSWALEPDSVRYAPPERLAGQPEDLAADTYALTLIAYEVITGRPLYDGHDPTEIERAVGLAQAAAELSRPNDLPRPVAQVFARALIFDPDARLTGRQYSDELAHLLESNVAGPSLSEIVETVLGSRKQGPRRSARLVSTDTAAFTRAELAALGDQEDEDDVELQVEDHEESRWGKVSRRRRRDEPEQVAAEEEALRRHWRRGPDPEPEVAPEPPRRRRKRGDREMEAAATPEPVHEREAAPEPESPRRRRLRSEPEPEPILEEAPSRRRLWRSGSEETKASSRRRRRSADQD